MSTVLVDTAAWIALVNTRDELHKQAGEVMAELRRRNVTLVTTEFVLLEYGLHEHRNHATGADRSGVHFRSSFRASWVFKAPGKLTPTK